MSGNKLYFIAGDTLPEVQGFLKDANGVAVDITGYTIKMHIGYTTVLTKTATLVTPASGEFKFTWLVTDLVQGTPQAEIEITDATGKIITVQETAQKQKLKLVIQAGIA